MGKNTGKAYEALTQRVFQAILAQEGLKNIVVQHDVDLKGKSATHQIDVYWEFEHGGILYRTVVQCKDWASPVKQEQVFCLNAVLDDLPGQPRGIIVSRTGFQQGAVDYAKAHGIMLYELRPPTDSDWEGSIREVHIDVNLLAPVVHAFVLLLDEPWVKEEKERLGLGLQPVPIKFSSAGDMAFTRENGAPITTTSDVIGGLIPATAGTREKRIHRFTEPAFFPTSHPTLSRVKVLGVEVDIEQTIAMTNVVKVNVTEFVEFILKNVEDGTFRRLDAQGRPLGPTPQGDNE